MSEKITGKNLPIYDKCYESSNKEQCDGYIDQCINQKDSSVSSFVLESKSGKTLNFPDFDTCINIAPRIPSLYGAPAGSKAKTQSSIPQHSKVKESGSGVVMKGSMVQSELSFIDDNNPKKSALELMVHEIIFEDENSCKVTPELQSRVYVGENNECKRLNDIMKLATDLVDKYIDARKSFYSKLDDLQKNPLSGSKDVTCSLNVSGSAGNRSYKFQGSKTCEAYKKAHKSFDKSAKSIANKIKSLRKLLRIALENNFRKLNEFDE